MGDENKVEVLFKTTADTSGAKAIQSEVKKVEQAVKGETAGTKESAAATQNLTVKKKDLLGNIKALSHEIPGLSSVLMLIKNPMVAVGVAIGALVGSIKAYFAKIEEAIEQQNLAEAVRKQVSSIAAIRVELAGASADFAGKLADAAAKGKTAADEFKKYADQLERVRDLQEKLADAELSREKSQIKLALAKKQITPIQAEEQTLAAEQRAEKRREDAEKRAEQGKRDNLGWAIGKTQGEVERARQARPSMDEIAQATVDAETFAKNKDNFDKEYDAQKTKYTKGQQNLTAAQAAYQKTGVPGGPFASHNYGLTEEERIEIGKEAGGDTAKSFRLSHELLDRKLETLESGKRTAALDVAKANRRKAELENRAAKADEKIEAGQERLTTLKEELAKEDEQQKQEAGIKTQIKTAKQDAQQTESETRIFGEREKRNKRIRELTQKRIRELTQKFGGGGSLTSEEQAEFAGLQGEQSADDARATAQAKAAAVAARPRAPHVSPKFQQAAEQFNLDTEPLASAMDNNRFVLQQLRGLLETKFKQQGEEIKEIIRRLDGVSTRQTKGLTEY